MSRRSSRIKRKRHRQNASRISASEIPEIRAFNILDDSCEPVEFIEAAAGEEKKTKAFSMLAYNGGKLRVSGFYYPIIVDLAGMKVSAKSRPVLRDHDPAQIVGHSTQIEINSGSIRVNGSISASNEYAREVQESSLNGFPWQASIGANPTKTILVDKGETVDVNGKRFTGPVYVARQSVLREISFVALGADDNTTASVAANMTKGTEMNKFEKWLKAKGFDAETITDEVKTSLQAMFDAEQEAETEEPAVKAKAKTETPDDDGEELPSVKAQVRAEYAAEMKKIAAIQKHAKDHPDIQAKAIEEDWSEDRVQLEVLRASRPSAPAGHVSDDDISFDILASAVLSHCGMDEDMIVKSYGEKTVEASHKHFRRGIGLQELFLQAAAMNGEHFRTYRGNEKAILRAAFSTTSLPGMLGNAANKMILEGFMNIEQTWREIATTKPVNDFKIHTGYRLTGDMQYEKVGPDGKLKHGEVGEQSYTNQAETYGKIFSLTRTDIRNDDLGAFGNIRARLGRGAALKINDVFWTEFLDNATFFATGNANYFEGASSNLQSSSLKTAVEKFRKLVDEDGKPMAVIPKLLLVGPENEEAADELYASTNVNTGGSSTTNKVPNKNTYAGKYRPVMSSYLSNSTYSGYSTTAWYLLADPQDLSTIEVVFLDGQEMPTIEEAEADFSTLGVQFRGYHDFGVSKKEYRAGVKSKGAA